MAYCGWAVGVNKIIIDSTNVTVGDGATVSDNLESGGLKKTRLLCSNPSDKFAVTMSFDFVNKNDQGYTEADLFWTWYKNVHKFGTVPFEFPAILLNSNRQAGESQETIEHLINRINNGDTSVKLPDREYYCITSAVSGQKSGLHEQVTMTWETYATGTIQVEDEDFAIDHFTCQNGYISIVLTEIPSFSPNSATWTVTVTNDGTTEQLSIANCIFNGDTEVVLMFEPFTEEGIYTITIGNESHDITIGEEG